MTRCCLKGSHWKASSAHTVLVRSLDRTSPLKEGCFHPPSALLLRLGWCEDKLGISKTQAKHLTLPLNSRVTLAKALHLHSLFGTIIVKSRADVTKYSISWLNISDMDLLEWVQRRPKKLSVSLSLSAPETGLESWGCSLWRREGSRET